MLSIDILTLFPNMFVGPFDDSIIKRAKREKLVEINIHDLRKWGLGTHQSVDDRPYGGGVGMVFMIEPMFNALADLKTQNTKVLLTSPQGKQFSQPMAKDLSQEEHLIIVCGHYEGYDERIVEHLADMEISIGDYVLTGGELPAMIITETVARLVPGVLVKPEAAQFESFETVDGQTLLETPHYTRPVEFNGWRVPEILLSGDHKKIENWRHEKAKEKTLAKRPDLVK
jgi:tRNA (guanine37-N1)-methyltransferase